MTTIAVNAAVEALLRDVGYASQSRNVNEAEYMRLAAALASLGLRVYSTSANFLLARSPQRATSAGDLRVIDEGRRLEFADYAKTSWGDARSRAGRHLLNH